ncbi:MAG TPA: hypothetical protein VHL14_11835 [Steroidobacteraceae bacterium]|jgi:hypothetical protein|nr:hypothetical protein [Steroidobacteraceae bacterium]
MYKYATRERVSYAFSTSSLVDAHSRDFSAVGNAATGLSLSFAMFVSVRISIDMVSRHVTD